MKLIPHFSGYRQLHYHRYQYCRQLSKTLFSRYSTFSGYPLDHQSCKFLVSSIKRNAFIWPLKTDEYLLCIYDLWDFPISGRELHPWQYSNKLQWKVWTKYLLFIFALNHPYCQIWARCWEPTGTTVCLEVRQLGSQRHGHPLGQQVILTNRLPGTFFLFFFFNFFHFCFFVFFFFSVTRSSTGPTRYLLALKYSPQLLARSIQIVREIGLATELIEWNIHKSGGVLFKNFQITLYLW